MNHLSNHKLGRLCRTCGRNVAPLQTSTSELVATHSLNFSSTKFDTAEVKRLNVA